MTPTPRCPSCRHFVYLDTLDCPHCDAQLGYHFMERQFRGIHNDRVIIDGATWYACSQRDWLCNWLVHEDAPAGRCFSCRLTRHSPNADDTIALQKLATTEEAKRRLLIQLGDLGLPIIGWDRREGGLGFDLLSSRSSGKKVMIGHAHGIITLDLAETLDDVREALRVRLGEPYRTMLGHLRHEVGHYYQNVLITEDQTWARCRELFGDERDSYKDALKRHYKFGAPEGWELSFISQYATMHPWEDFAETFAHYLHITATLQTAAAIGIRIDSEVNRARDVDVVPRLSYSDESIGLLLTDWEWMSGAFNRINRSMGLGDLYPFDISDPARDKLAFVHELISRAPLTTQEQVEFALAPEEERA